MNYVYSIFFFSRKFDFSTGARFSNDRSFNGKRKNHAIGALRNEREILCGRVSFLFFHCKNHRIKRVKAETQYVLRMRAITYINKVYNRISNTQIDSDNKTYRRYYKIESINSSDAYACCSQ